MCLRRANLLYRPYDINIHAIYTRRIAEQTDEERRAAEEEAKEEAIEQALLTSLADQVRPH